MNKSIASVQYAPTAGELAVLLALARGGTLAEAAVRLGADASTVFRTVQRVEKQGGQRLFERGRKGYLQTDAMAALAPHAARIEAELEAARAVLAGPHGEVTGRVRLTPTDSVL